MTAKKTTKKAKTSKLTTREKQALKLYGRIKYVVDRSKWVRGVGSSGGTGLLVGTKYSEWSNSMCCLGHCMLQDGFSSNKLRGKAMPQEAVSLQLVTEIGNGKLRPSPFFNAETDSYVDERYRFFADDSELSHNAAEINDDASISDDEREEQLIALFKRHGLRLSFKGKYKNGKYDGDKFAELVK